MELHVPQDIAESIARYMDYETLKKYCMVSTSCRDASKVRLAYLAEKEEYLFKFERLKRLGINVHNTYNMTSDLEVMKFEYEKLKRDRDVENSVRFTRKLFMACITGLNIPEDIKRYMLS